MPVTLASTHDAIPMATSASNRDTLFPSPMLNQRVQRLDVQTIERWLGSSWMVDSDLGGANRSLASLVALGATDHTTAFQAAADAGGEWVVPAGTWVTGSVTITKSVTFVGRGWTSIVQVKSGTTGVPFLVQDPGLNDEIPFVAFHRLKLDGNHQGQANAGLLQINNAVPFEVVGCWVTNAGTASNYVNGIAVSAGTVGGVGSMGRIVGNLIDNCAKAGVNVTTESKGVGVTGNIIRNCTSNLGEVPGVQLNGGFNATVTGNWIYNCQGPAIYAASTTGPTNADYAIIADNHIWDCGETATVSCVAWGVRVADAFSAGAVHLTIRGNKCYSGGSANCPYGISVSNQEDVQVVDNVVVQSYWSGFFFSVASRLLVRGNRAVNCNTAGHTDLGGFLLVAVDDSDVESNRAYNTAGVTTSKYGMTFYTTATTNTRFRNNNFLGNASGPYLVSVATTGCAFEGERFEEELTLSTGGATTDSSANLLPAAAIIEAVQYEVTASITTAASFSIGDATTAARFVSGATTLTTGQTGTGLLHWRGGVSTDATGPTQGAAAKIRITANTTPGAGKVKVRVIARYYT